MSDGKSETKPDNFEAALAELETLVSQMEDGDLSLEASLNAFENGIKLTRQCQQALQQAELKVQRLSQSDDGHPELQPLDTEADASS